MNFDCKILHCERDPEKAEIQRAVVNQANYYSLTAISLVKILVKYINTK